MPLQDMSTAAQVTVVAVLIPVFLFLLKKLGRRNGPPLQPLFKTETANTFVPMIVVAKTQLNHDTIDILLAMPHHPKGRDAQTLTSVYKKLGGQCDIEARRQYMALKLHQFVTHKSNSTETELRPPYCVAGIAPGRHVRVRANVGGKDVQRSFSPTSSTLEEAVTGVMQLTIKVYRPSADGSLPGGVLSQHLADAVHVGDTVEVRGPTGLVEYTGEGLFHVKGQPLSMVPTSAPTQFSHIVMIAGGSGITPMLAVLKAILHAKKAHLGAQLESLLPCDVSEATNTVRRVTLLYSNHTIDDIMFREWLQGETTAVCRKSAMPSDVPMEAVGAEDTLPAGFRDVAFLCHKANTGSEVLPIAAQLVYFISRPKGAVEAKAISSFNKTHKGDDVVSQCMESGRITAESLTKYVPADPTGVAVLLCGPKGLEDGCKTHLAAMGYTRPQILLV